MDVHTDSEGQPHPSEELRVDGMRPGEHRTIELAVAAMADLKVLVTLDGSPASGSRLIGIPGTRLDLVDSDLWNRLDLPKATVPDDGIVDLSGMIVGRMTLSATLPGSHFAAYMALQADRPIDGVVPFPILTGEKRVAVRDRGADRKRGWRWS